MVARLLRVSVSLAEKPKSAIKAVSKLWLKYNVAKTY
jgi:hypothetical protein